MQPPSTAPPPPCCLLFVVQATASMRARLGAPLAGGGPRPSKIKAAMHVVGRTLRTLLGQAGRDAGASATLDVGILVYRGDDSGRTTLLAPLPGATPVQPLVSLASLSHLEPFAPEGEAGAADALAVAAGVLRAWLADHPGAARPLVVHVTDGAGCDEALARASRSLCALTARGQNVALYHCVLSEAALPPVPRPATAADLPPGPCQVLWNLSTPHGGGRRQLSVNDLSAAAGIAWLARPRGRKGVPEDAAAPGLSGRRLEAHSLWVQKGSNAAPEWEDAFAIDPARGLAAVSDGAGEGIFCRLWATILTQRLCEEEPAPDDPAALARWLDGCRARWLGAINFPGLRPPQQHRVRTTGAGGTLLALRLGAGPAGAPDRFAWSAWAVGDSCLFWVRDNRLWATFPAVDAADFGINPPLLRTHAGGPVVTPLFAGGMGQMGDLFLLATDATAQLLLRRCEEGKSEWEGVWDWDQAVWHDKVALWRRAGDMVNDDCTLVAVRPVPGRPAENCAGSDEAFARPSSDGGA